MAPNSWWKRQVWKEMRGDWDHRHGLVDFTWRPMECFCSEIKCSYSQMMHDMIDYLSLDVVTDSSNQRSAVSLPKGIINADQNAQSPVLSTL